MTSEFDQRSLRLGRSEIASTSGLADDSYLIVAEPKRDGAPDAVEMQAIR